MDKSFNPHSTITLNESGYAKVDPLVAYKFQSTSSLSWMKVPHVVAVCNVNVVSIHIQLLGWMKVDDIRNIAARIEFQSTSSC